MNDQIQILKFQKASAYLSVLMILNDYYLNLAPFWKNYRFCPQIQNLLVLFYYYKINIFTRLLKSLFTRNALINNDTISRCQLGKISINSSLQVLSYWSILANLPVLHVTDITVLLILIKFNEIIEAIDIDNDMFVPRSMDPIQHNPKLLIMRTNTCRQSHRHRI